MKEKKKHPSWEDLQQIGCSNNGLSLKTPSGSIRMVLQHLCVSYMEIIMFSCCVT